VTWEGKVITVFSWIPSSLFYSHKTMWLKIGMQGLFVTVLATPFFPSTILTFIIVCTHVSLHVQLLCPQGVNLCACSCKHVHAFTVFHC
jgi:hypothetical protein